MRRSLAAMILGLALLTVPEAEAKADHVVLAAGTTYLPPVNAVAPGDGLDFQNLDPLPHDVTARDVDEAGKPLFASATVGLGVRTDVVGVEDLEAGSYQYYCTIHPWMAGLLNVLPVEPIAPPGPASADVGAPAVAAAVPTPTSVSAFGGHLYAASYVTGSVHQMEILPEGLLGPAVEYATGFSAPLGIAFADDGTLFVADSHASARADRTTAGRVWAVPAGGGAASTVGEVVLDELPNGRHNTNGLAVHGGRLFVTNGNSTDDGVTGGEPEEPLSGTLLSVPLDARGLVVGGPGDPLPTGLVVEATGMRNDYDVAFRPGTNEAWLTSNGPDRQDPWGEDLLHRVDVAGDAADFGFPACLYRAGPGGPTDPVWNQNARPEITDTCSDASHVAPEVTLGLHTSADGLAFGPEEGWGGDLYIAEFGNFFGRQVVGHRVVRVPIGPAGEAGAPVDVLVGVTPLDLTFGPPGTGMYVADFGASQILLVKPLP